jgi:hypothetical protein
MSYDAMYQYYGEQTVLPTHGHFQSQSQLDLHERHRHELFTQKLFLPPRLFRDARLIEFGPDAGENSLVFAHWGAVCTLIEPNPKAHSVITAYFQQFGLTDKLAGLQRCDVKAFAEQQLPTEKFDFVDAEGFIYTVKPASLWIDLFGRITNDNAFVILFYCDPFGNFFELFKKVIHSRVRELTRGNALETAQKLFLTKWNSIPHKRSLESWVMDVLENPFVRLAYLLEPQALCRQMFDAGLHLYSAWPPYHDGLNVYWFKKTLSAEEQLNTQESFIARSRLSHLFGRKHFLLHPDPEAEQTLRTLLAATDALIDHFDQAQASTCLDCLSKIEKLLGSDAVISDEKDTEEALRAIRSTRHILQLLADEKVESLVTFCNEDPGFIRTWGMPSQFAVFQKRNSPEPTP